MIEQKDGLALGYFFGLLSDETKSRFAPHPLTPEYAKRLCINESGDTAERFVLECDRKIIGYFILEYVMSVHEANRYRQFGVNLKSNQDILFAPCILDEYQNKGLASQVMMILIQHAKEKRMRSIVLMGGTQETNIIAKKLYEKYGFKKYGGYQTDIYNIDMRLELHQSQ
ncbi:MAG: GNAT family N-acetyltransferase [Sedimentisphaerales bacterium]|nr:GNAT family N-acetyltransferase [Sedimentisphaerales bacterium]